MDLAREHDRLASLALAAGKDVNDELTFMLNHAELSRTLLSPEHPVSIELVEMQHAVLRCAETTRCLIMFAQRARDLVQGALRQEALIDGVFGDEKDPS